METVSTKQTSYRGIDRKVFDWLPENLRKAVFQFEEEHEQDIFLVGALPVIGAALPHVRGEIRNGWVTPHFYTVVIAPPASGKGALRRARQLGDGIESRLIREAKEYDAWLNVMKSNGSTPKSQSDEGKFKAPPREAIEPHRKRPEARKFFVPGNSSAAAFAKDLQNNNGNAVIFEEEITTLVKTFGQDWGNYSDDLRKAFQHESITLGRMDRQINIPDPHISVVLSGTPGQFRQLVSSPEDGFFSRIGLYFYAGGEPWKSLRPTARSRARETFFQKASRRLDRLYVKLKTRSKPLLVEWTGEQWDYHDKIFGGFLKSLQQDGHAIELQATVKRGGLIAFRIAMILAVLRKDGEGEDLQSVESITATDEDVQAALWITTTLMGHAFRWSKRIKKNQQSSSIPGGAVRLLDKLPDEFTRSQAVSIGQNELNLGESAIDKYLRQLKQTDYIEPIAGTNGRYRKLPGD